MGGLLRAHVQLPRGALLRHEGQATGIKSKAMTSPCGKIRIPINEEGNEKAGQIQEYLDRYHGEGIQHIALASRQPVRHGGRAGAQRREAAHTSDTYYELLDKRIPGHGEDLWKRKQRNILVDGTPGALLLQIFSENQLGPIFFEFIQRKGNQGFGEGNFKALFETMELDQMRRGVERASAFTDARTAGSKASATWAAPGNRRLSAPGSVAVDAGNTMLSVFEYQHTNRA
jgi:4-hydroxyphenylpyruvate dioxygenase